MILYVIRKHSVPVELEVVFPLVMHTKYRCMSPIDSVLESMKYGVISRGDKQLK